MPTKKISPISDKELQQVKLTLEKDGFGISSDIVRSIVLRLENSEIVLGVGSQEYICANCREPEKDCECEVYSAIKS